MPNRRVSPLMWLGVALVIAIALMAIFGALAYSTYANSNDGYYGMMDGGSWGWSILMMGIPAVILILILVVVLVGIREPEPVTLPGTPPSPLETLSGRYARNEISREEYLRARDDLIGTSGGMS